MADPRTTAVQVKAPIGQYGGGFMISREAKAVCDEHGRHGIGVEGADHGAAGGEMGAQDGVRIVVLTARKARELIGPQAKRAGGHRTTIDAADPTHGRQITRRPTRRRAARPATAPPPRGWSAMARAARRHP